MLSCAVVMSCALILTATGCGSGPAAPSRTAAAPTSFGNVPHASITTQADLSRCLAGAGEAACFSARPLTAASAGAAAITSSPINLTASVSGSTVVLSWTAPSSQDSPVTSYVVEAGSGSGLANLANVNTGNASTTLTAPGVPAGTYYVRVRAANATGVSGPSNEVVVVVSASGPCSGPPGAPSGLAVSASGSTVTLSWSAPSGGCPPTTYVIQAGSTPGSSNLANSPTGSLATSFSASGVAAGTYYIRVRAANATGVGGASNEAVITLGGAPAPTPTAPGSGPLTGRWVGLVSTLGDGYRRSEHNPLCDRELNQVAGTLESLDVTMDLVQNGNSVTGTLTTRVVVGNTPPSGIGCVPLVVGSVANYSINATAGLGRGGTGALGSSFSGTLGAGRTITGILVVNQLLSGSVDDGGGSGFYGTHRQ
jgi:hypothetical protein